jgi:uncharacterized protein (DUF433 family)
MVIETTQTVRLKATEDGTIRVAGTRVSLDSIVHHFKLGATAEQIAHKFPALELADVYGAIAFYLSRRAAVEDYLCRQEAESDEAQQRLESAPGYQTSAAAMRERLLARWRERH